MTTATVQSPDCGTVAVTMMISGSAGMTRNTLETADRLSPAAPDR